MEIDYADAWLKRPQISLYSLGAVLRVIGEAVNFTKHFPSSVYLDAYKKSASNFCVWDTPQTTFIFQ